MIIKPRSPIVMSGYSYEIPDISLYQNYREDNVETTINFAKVAQHPKLLGVIVKASEGSWVGYPDDKAVAQMDGFTNVGKPVIPYHFWKYLVPAGEQAKRFKTVRLKASLLAKQGAIDVEDTGHPDSVPPKHVLTKEEYPEWIPKARSIAGSVKETFNAIAQDLGSPPIWYGGAWFQDWWTQLCIMDGVDMSWMKLFPFWCASYTSPVMYLCENIDFASTILWQRTSEPLPEEQIEGFPWKERLDMNYWLKTEQEWNEFVGITSGTTPPPPGGTTLALTHDVNVLQEQRAWVLEIAHNEKITVLPEVIGADGFILEAGWAKYINGQLSLMAAENFGDRCRMYASKVAIGALFDIEPGAFVRVGWTEQPFNQGIFTDPILEVIINALHNGSWDWGKIVEKKGVWNPFNFIVIKMVNKEGYPLGTSIGNDWVTRVLRQTIDHLFYMQDNLMLPSVPVFFQSSTEEEVNKKSFLEIYDEPDSQFNLLLQRLSSRMWMSLEQTALFSTRVFVSAHEIFLSGPQDGFSWNYVPQNYFNKVLLHKFSGPQKIYWFVDTSGAMVPVKFYKWCSDVANMFEFLKYKSGTIIPPEPPTPPVPPTETTLEEVKKDLELLKEKFKIFEKLFEWFKKVVKDFVENFKS